MSLAEVYNMMTNEEIIAELKDKKLLVSGYKCKGTQNKPHEEKTMKIVKRSCLDGYCWRCNYCGSRKSLRVGSLFEGHRLSIIIIFKLIIHFVLQSKYQNMQAIFNCSRQFVYEFYHRLRFIALRNYDRKNVKLGGPGIIVEIDESLFMKVKRLTMLGKYCYLFSIFNILNYFQKVKHNRGKDLRRKQVWVFGLRERVTGRCFFEIVPSRDREELLSIIYRHCQPDSVIFSDKWKAYNDIKDLDARFKHRAVNHKIHFVDPQPEEINGECEKVHTNGIESDWNACKNRFRVMRGKIFCYLSDTKYI